MKEAPTTKQPGGDATRPAATDPPAYFEVPEDLSGRDRIAWNVLTSWAGYLLVIVAGFVMPRLVDRIAGQEALGIWDFCWSLVNYVSLMGLGVGSSVNRYVALYRAKGDNVRLSRSVSAVVAIQIVIGVLVLLTSLLLAWILPIYFWEHLGGEVAEARWVVGLLGASLAVEMFLNPARGVMTGCHEWGLSNWINVASRGGGTVLMLATLMLGGGLKGMSVAYLATVVVTEVYRTVASLRVCPELRIHLDQVRWSDAREMFVFGGKSIIVDLPALLLVQTASVVVAGALGPAALAVFSRPLALIRHIQAIINKFSQILVPTASSLHGSGSRAELREFTIEMTRYGMIFTAPMVVTLVVYGDLILRVWMGERYANGMVMAALALGYFLPVAQNSVTRILAGMNMHGVIGLLGLLLGGLMFGIGLLGLMTTGWNLTGIALVLGLSMTIGGGVLTPLYTCHRLEIPLRKYLARVFVTPVLCNLVYAGILWIFRSALSDHPVRAFVTGTGAGAVVLGFLYWRYLFSEPQRTRVRGLVLEPLRRLARRPRTRE